MNSFKRSYILLCLLAISVCACKKKTLPLNSVTNTPVFNFSGHVNGAPVIISAGVNSYYMYSSFAQDANNMYSFIGKIQQINSANNSITIQFNDAKATNAGGTSYANNTLQVGSYMYASTDTTAPKYTIKYSTIAPNSYYTYYWDFGDGTNDVAESPTHTYATQGAYNVCLTVQSLDSLCSNTVCNTQKVGYATSVCKVSISTTATQSSTVAFTTTTTGTAPFYYSWDFGDSTTSMQPNPTHTYPDSGTYYAKLQVIDSSNDTANVNYVVQTNNIAPCSANYTAIAMPNAPILNFNKVVITWVNASGVAYTSNLGKQPANTMFKIVSVDEYVKNERGELCKKIKINFSCLLYNGSNAIQINNGEATIAVAYQ